MRQFNGVRVAGLAAALLLAASSAQAFTLGSGGASDSGGSAVVDPDEQLNSFGAGAAAMQEGGRAVHFGVAPSFGSGPTSSLVRRPASGNARSWPAPGTFPDHQ
jgi:hypothetical protein